METKPYIGRGKDPVFVMKPAVSCIGGPSYQSKPANIWKWLGSRLAWLNSLLRAACVGGAASWEEAAVPSKQGDQRRAAKIEMSPFLEVSPE